MDVWFVAILLLILVLGAVYWNRRLLRSRPSKKRRFMEGKRRFSGEGSQTRQVENGDGRS